MGVRPASNDEAWGAHWRCGMHTPCLGLGLVFFFLELCSPCDIPWWFFPLNLDQATPLMWFDFAWHMSTAMLVNVTFPHTILSDYEVAFRA